MDMSISVGIWNREYPENDLEPKYRALFELFDGPFRGLRSLRLELLMPPYDPFRETFHGMKMKAILEPMVQLSKTRSWTRLQLCVPVDWHAYFNELKEKMGDQAEWQLTETQASRSFSCLAMT